MGDTDGKRGVVRAREATGATREERRGRGRNDSVVPLREKEKVPARRARRRRAQRRQGAEMGAETGPGGLLFVSGEVTESQ